MWAAAAFSSGSLYLVRMDGGGSSFNVPPRGPSPSHALEPRGVTLDLTNGDLTTSKPGASIVHFRPIDTTNANSYLYKVHSIARLDGCTGRVPRMDDAPTLRPEQDINEPGQGVDEPGQGVDEPGGASSEAVGRHRALGTRSHRFQGPRQAP